jgi:septal ring factor EnvC (AmiA/AmiB activator)
MSIRILGVAIKCFFCLLLISSFVIADSPEMVKNKRKQAEQKLERIKIETEEEFHKANREARQAEKELRETEKEERKAEKKLRKARQKIEKKN